MTKLLRALFFLIVVRPLVFVFLGLNVRNRELLPKSGPAIICANHNSHLDTLVLMSLYPISRLPLLRPVASAEYFLRSPALAWFATNIIGILPIDRRLRQGALEERLRGCMDALERHQILILFPEGTRGQPEEFSEFKSGVALLSKLNPQVPVIPLFLHGLGKALPRGSAWLVPFYCDVLVGRPMTWTGDRRDFMARLEGHIKALAAEGKFPLWE